MDDLARLAALEDIRRLKALYWRGVDTKDAALLRGVFTDDAAIDFTEDDKSEGPLPDPDSFVKRCLGMLHNVVTMHHGHMPDIEFISETEATGFWPMEDNLWCQEGALLPFRHLHGYGFYYDRYVKTAQGWKIAATTLKRSHVDISQ